MILPELVPIKDVCQVPRLENKSKARISVIGQPTSAHNTKKYCLEISLSVPGSRDEEDAIILRLTSDGFPKAMQTRLQDQILSSDDYLMYATYVLVYFNEDKNGQLASQRLSAFYLYNFKTCQITEYISTNIVSKHPYDVGIIKRHLEDARRQIPVAKLTTRVPSPQALEEAYTEDSNSSQSSVRMMLIEDVSFQNTEGPFSGDVATQIIEQVKEADPGDLNTRKDFEESAPSTFSTNAMLPPSLDIKPIAYDNSDLEENYTEDRGSPRNDNGKPRKKQKLNPTDVSRIKSGLKALVNDTSRDEACAIIDLLSELDTNQWPELVRVKQTASLLLNDNDN